MHWECEFCRWSRGSSVFELSQSSQSKTVTWESIKSCSEARLSEDLDLWESLETRAGRWWWSAPSSSSMNYLLLQKPWNLGAADSQGCGLFKDRSSGGCWNLVGMILNIGKTSSLMLKGDLWLLRLPLLVYGDFILFWCPNLASRRSLELCSRGEQFSSIVSRTTSESAKRTWSSLAD